MIDKNDSDKKSLFTRVMEAVKNFITEKNPEFLSNIEGTYNKNGFIEPDIDDYHPGDEGPPLKRARYISDYEVSSTNIGSETIVSSTVTNKVTKDK